MSKKNFYQQHSLFTLERIKHVERIKRRPKQPKFIEMFSINHRPVAFLGPKIANEDDLLEKFIRVDRMVIPEFARMVKSDFLLNEINSNQDNKAVDTNVDGLFYSGKLKDSILLDVCGELNTTTFKDLHFHNCDNQLPTARPSREIVSKEDNSGITFRRSGNGYETCPDTILNTSITNSKNELVNENIENRLTIFYLSKKDIEKTDEQIKKKRPPEGANSTSNFTIEEMLEQYFTDNHYEGSVFVDINWCSLKGLFLIPMLFSDQRIVYYCLLNVDGMSNIDVPIKETLKIWLETVKKYNLVENDAVIAGNDGGYFYMEEWSIFISKNNLMKGLPIDLVYPQEVLDNRIS